MFYIPIQRRFEFSGKGLWPPKATSSVTHIHILPTYKPRLRYFILSVTKRERGSQEPFSFMTKKRQNYPKEIALRHEV